MEIFRYNEANNYLEIRESRSANVERLFICV